MRRLPNQSGASVELEGGEAGRRGNSSLGFLNENHLLSSLHLQMISWAQGENSHENQTSGSLVKVVYKVHLKRLSYERAQANIAQQMRKFFQQTRRIFQKSIESKRELSFGR